MVPIKEFDRGSSKAILIMPDMVATYISETEIHHDLKYKNIKKVAVLPADVYDVCKANFDYYFKKVGIYAN